MKTKHLKSLATALVIGFSLASYIYLNYTIPEPGVADQALEIINNDNGEANIFADLGILKGAISKVVELVTFSS